MNMIENNLNSGKPKPIIKRDELGRFLPGNPPGPGWKNRTQETQKLVKLRDDLLDGSKEAIEELRRLLRESQSENVKVNASKILILCAKIIPDQVFHESWKIILKQEEGTRKDGLLASLPDFGKSLQWKQLHDSGRDQ